MSERLRPTRWHLGVEIGKNEAGEFLVCPECGEYVTTTMPVDWQPMWGPAPGFSHLLDGSALCPVIGTGDGVSGYVPATACSRREYDDANGCPCDTAYWCQCSCGDCFCRQAGIAPVDQEAHGFDTRGQLIAEVDVNWDEIARKASLIGGTPGSGKSMPVIGEGVIPDE
jgi:hypothetical protein